ncbi:MAG: hypothetical protein ACO3DU_04110 [Ilumatobacteraceae bacterium]
MTVTMELGVSGRVGLVCVPTDLMVIWPLDVVVIGDAVSRSLRHRARRTAADYAVIE